MEGPKGKLDLTLKAVNKTDIAQKKEHPLCNLEVQQPLGPQVEDFGEREDIIIMVAVTS